MFGSLVRIATFTGIVGALAWAAYRLMEDTGSVRIDIGGFEYALTPIAAVFSTLLGFLALVFVFKLIGILHAVYKFLLGDETAIDRVFHRSRERRGWDALTKAMIALTEGDGYAANAGSAKAARLLKRPALPRLMLARSAEMIGDQDKAEACYTALAKEKQTAFVGVKGLIELAQLNEDEEQALELTQYAQRLRPRDPWVLDTLYTLQSRGFDWEGARKTLSTQRRAGQIPKPEANRRDAMLALAQAEDADEKGEAEQARKLALEATKLDPENMDAVSTAARHLVAAGHNRTANRLILRAWRIRPCAQLAAAYAAIKPDETPAERVERFQTLLKIEGTGTEANLVRAELALTVGDWAGARRAMNKIAEDEPSARSCAIMAAIARGDGEPDAVVRAWLAKALGAPRDEAEGSVLDHAAMLPLLVGVLDEPEGLGAEKAEAGEAEAEETAQEDAEPEGFEADEPEAEETRPEETEAKESEPEEAEAPKLF